MAEAFGMRVTNGDKRGSRCALYDASRDLASGHQAATGQSTTCARVQNAPALSPVILRRSRRGRERD
jgi:hypothetical protein